MASIMSFRHVHRFNNKYLVKWEFGCGLYRPDACICSMNNTSMSDILYRIPTSQQHGISDKVDPLQAQF